MYRELHTSMDVMKEFMIFGAEFEGKYDMPVLAPCRLDTEPLDSVDFDSSFKLRKDHRKTNINFYVDDCKFQRLWNNPDKYLEHLKCFHSVCGLDFTLGLGTDGMPFALNLYNKYRNQALSYYLQLNGINVIPNVQIGDMKSWDWCFDGIPKHSVLSCSTNGRIRSKDARIEFCDGFREMVERLEPTHVIVVGKIPDELQTNVHLINYKSRNQKMNERLGDK